MSLPTSYPRLCRYAAMATAVLAIAAAPVHAAPGGLHLALFDVDQVQGSGKAATEQRNLAPFQAIAISVPIRLTLRQSGREAIELRADDNLLPLLETRVVDQGGVPTLTIGVQRGHAVRTSREITATVDLATLRALTISGSGEVEAAALKSPALQLTISGSADVRIRGMAVDEAGVKVAGSGDVELAGRVRKLVVSISGTGDVNASGLEAEAVQVGIAGTGDARVRASQSLGVSIAGVGSVRYAGDPVVKSSIAGHGEVKKE